MLKGSHITEETRAKVSGENNHNYGKPMSEKNKAALYLANKGKNKSAKARSKMSASKMGEKNPTFGKPKSEETRLKMSEAQRGEKNHQYGKPQSPKQREKLLEAHLGRTCSPETLAKMSNAQKGNKNHAYGKHQSPETKMKKAESMRGEKCYLWKGGISFEPYCPKFSRDLRRRIRAFFKDQCVMCGNPNINGHLLDCHHMTYNKKMCCDGKPVRFAALCGHHHSMTNHGDRQRWEDMLHRAIDEIWDGKSYFTKEEYALFEFGESG